MISWEFISKKNITIIVIVGFLVGTIFINYFEEAEGLKSKGNFVKKFGLATKNLVCGDKLCSESPELSELESFQAIESLVFFDCNSDVMCMISYLNEIEVGGEKTLLSEFNTIISVLEKNTTYCHAPAHHLGGFLYEYTNDLQIALSVADSRCGGAIFHGILDTFFEKSNLNSISMDEIMPSKICSNKDDEFSLDRYECLHGLGHGLTVFYDYDVFKAITHCGDFSEDWEVDTCSNGVFMQNIDRYLSVNGGMFEQNDIFYPCNKMDSKYAPACYHHQNTFMLVQNNYSIPNTFSDCDEIIPQEFIKYCYRGMGRQLAPVSSSIDVPIDPEIKYSHALEICQKGQVQFQKYCLMGMVRVIIDQDSLNKGFEFCESFPEQFWHDCYSLLGVWIKISYNSSNDQIKQCSKAKDLHNFDVCINSSIREWELIQG